MYNISVSKFCNFCCPVCWQLLKVLNETNNNIQFTACAHHSNLYAVCLPPWLPEPVLEKMIEHFRKQLYEKLYQLHIQVQPGQPGHHRDLSLESAGESVSNWCHHCMAGSGSLSSSPWMTMLITYHDWLGNLYFFFLVPRSLFLRFITHNLFF